MRLVRTTPVAAPADRPRALPELALVVGLFLAYKLARVLIQRRDDVAFGNAWRIWDLEHFLHLPAAHAARQLAAPHTNARKSTAAHAARRLAGAAGEGREVGTA